jgi:hypothetical protein
MDSDKRERTRRLQTERRSTERRKAAPDGPDLGRRATSEEASQAWAGVNQLLRTIGRWNLPKAANYIRGNPPTAETIALGFFALDIFKRSEAGLHGAKGGRAYGFKGGRPSKKPLRVDLQKKYDTLVAACGNARQARASLVKELQESTQAKVTTVRGWLRGAGIKKR